MLETEVTVNRFLVGYCKTLVDDLDDARFAEQPVAGVNHPAWILGHLTVVAHRAISLLTGGETDLPDAWKTLFGPGSKLTANRSDYPPKGYLVRAVEESYERLRRTIAEAKPERLSQPSPHPRTKAMLPEIKDLISFLLTGHMGVHLGQLTTWRRMIGLPALF